MRGENISKGMLFLSENSLRRIIRRTLLERGHTWSVANDSLLMLDREGMEEEDRNNVSKFLKSMRMID